MITIQSISGEIVRKLTTVTSEEILTREELERIFPHSAHALVASYAVVDSEGSSLVLSQADFGPYVDGHFPGQPIFPMHWVFEMSAQAAGLGALRLMLKEAPEKAAENRIVLQQNLGSWNEAPLMVNPNNPNGLTITAYRNQVYLSIDKNASYMACTTLRSGKSGSSITNIRARLSSENSLARIMERISR
jgi:hypothetical protein